MPLVDIDLPNAVVVVVVVAERFIVAECAFSVAEARVGKNILPPFLLLLVTPALLLLLLMLLLLLLLDSNKVEESTRANCNDERREVKRSAVVCASHFGSAVVVAVLAVSCFVEPIISFWRLLLLMSAMLLLAIARVVLIGLVKQLY